MRCGFAKGLLAVSALYGVGAVCAFLVHFAPVPTKGIDLWVISSAVSVVLPYAMLFAVCRLASDSLSVTVVTCAAILTTLLGGFVYFHAFGPNDGEYALAFFIVPIVQAPIVVVAWAVTWWRRRESHSVAA